MHIVTLLNRHIFISLILVFLIALPSVTQDAEITEEPTIEAVPTLLPLATPTPTATLQPTPNFTNTPTTLPQVTSIPTIVPTAILSETMTSITPTLAISISGTAAITPSYTLTPFIEVTGEVTPVSATQTQDSIGIGTPTPMATVSSTEMTITPTAIPISATTVSISSTITSVSATITPTIMPTISATQVMTTVTPTFQPTATIGGVALRYIQGVAIYQNNAVNNSNILLQIYSDKLALVSEVKTNEQGVYSVAVPMNEAFWLVLSAQGHLAQRIYINTEDNPADITMIAGDLNNDDCINFDDIRLIQREMYLADAIFDLNGDEQTNLSDVALLAGNIDSSCITTDVATATPTVDVEVTAEVTIEVTDAPANEIIATLEPTATVQNIMTPTAMESISPTTGETVTIEAETTEDP